MDTKNMKPQTDAEKFVASIAHDDGAKAGKYLEEMLKKKVAERIKETLI